jgi:hypothetical protein
MRRILSATIWNPTSLPLVQKRFRPIFTVYLPLVDGFFILLGIFGLWIGSKVIQDFTLPWYNTFWSFLIGTAALCALLGLLFEWLWVEMLGKLILVVSLASYGLLLGLNVATGAYNSALTITLTLIVILTPAFRIGDLVGQIAKREGADV